MAATIFETEAQPYLGDLSRWPVPTMPPVPFDPWADSTPAPFWRDDVSTRARDDVRTAALAAYSGVEFQTAGGNPPYAGSAYGMPYHVFTEQAKKPTTTRVLDLSREPTYGPWKAQWAWPPFYREVLSWPIDDVPLPHPVRREGDPGNFSDRHVYLLDAVNRELWEVILLLHQWTPAPYTEWTSGYTGSARGVCRWDLKRPWNADGQPRGVVAAMVPHFPMIARADRLLAAAKAGAPLDTMLFASLPNYRKTFEGAARHTDGDLADHPCAAGTILRLHPEVAAGVKAGTFARALADTATKRGVFIGDRNAHGVDGKKGNLSAALAMDRSIHEGSGTVLGLRQAPLVTTINGVTRKITMADFDVLRPAAA